MSHVVTVAPDQASGQVAEVYSAVHARMGRVPNAVQAFSASPELLALVAAQNAYYGPHPSLGFALLAFIRLLVSQDNECAYCVGFNEALLIERAGLSADEVAQARRDPRAAPLSEKDLAMLLFCVKAAKHPRSVSAAEINALRTRGWTDRDIVDGLYHAARNAAIDIMLDALGVENDF